MSIPRDSAKCRRIVLETWRKLDEAGRPYMLCKCGRELRPSCNEPINPAHHWTWRAHHIILKADGGEDTPENLVPIRTICDVKETAPEDTKRMAKNKRIRDRRSGVKTPKSPLMGSRSHPSGLRKRMNGKVERWK